MLIKELLEKPYGNVITIRELKEALNKIEESDLDLPVYIYSYDDALEARDVYIGNCDVSENIYGLRIDS